MTGQVFGTIRLPPESASQWSLADGEVYGCPLCHRGSLKLMGYDDNMMDELELVNIGQVTVLPRHGTTVRRADLPKVVKTSPWSICVSMGHIYLQQIDPTSFTIALTELDTEVVSILVDDVPFGVVFYHRDRFCCRADVDVERLLVPKAADELVGYNYEHFKLDKSRIDDDLYSTVRDRFIGLITTRLLPRRIKLDTALTQQLAAGLVRSVECNGENVSLTLFWLQGRRSHVYTCSVGYEKLIYKYVKLDLQNDTSRVDRWNIEQANNELINRNLERLPTLPYPYTYKQFRLANTGVSVSQQIEFVQTLRTFTKQYQEQSLHAIIEAMAVLAEAHQGDTVRYHFIHLDAHGENFLVATFGENVRVCSQSRPRTTRFHHQVAYKFDQHGYRLYLIDFEFSYFAHASKWWIEHPDLSFDLTDASQTDAPDFIMLYRQVVYSKVMSLVRSMAEHRLNSWDEQLVKDYIVVVMVGSAMIRSQILAVVRDVVNGRITVPISQSTSPYSVQEFAQRLLSYQTQTFDLELVNEIVMYIGWMVYHNTDYNALNLLFGAFASSDYREIHQRHLEPLSREALDYLGNYVRRFIADPPADLRGIPLFLYYIHAAGIDCPLIVETPT